MTTYRSTNIAGQMIVLGSGTSVGVPALGCGCDVCTSTDPKNQRTRSSVILGLPEGNLLVDTTPDMRSQLLREAIGIVHAVVFTHGHADHVYGLDDVRMFPLYLGHAVPIYCDTQVEARIRTSFDYAFSSRTPTYAGGIPQLDMRRIDHRPFEVLGARVVPIPLRHGRLEVLGFRVGNVAYCTDTNGIPEETWPLLTGLDTLILDALRARPHPTHFSLEEAIEAARRIGARQTYFTHIAHELDHAATNAALPPGMALAYDGLRISLSQ